MVHARHGVDGQAKGLPYQTLVAGARMECWEAKGDTHSDNFEGTSCQAAVLDRR